MKFSKTQKGQNMSIYKKEVSGKGSEKSLRKYKITIEDATGKERVEYAYGTSAADIRERYTGVLWKEGERATLKAYPTPEQIRLANAEQRKNNPDYKKMAGYRTMKSQAKRYVTDARDEDLVEHAIALRNELKKRGLSLDD